METLCELALINPKIVSITGGLKAIFQGMLSGPKELMDVITDTFMCLLDGPPARNFIRPYCEIDVIYYYLMMQNILSEFIDAYTSKGAYNIEKLEIAAQIIQKVLSSWTG